MIIRQLENLDIPSIDMLLTVSRSRKIYYIIEIEDMPLTPNGKVDTERLPHIERR